MMRVTSVLVSLLSVVLLGEVAMVSEAGEARVGPLAPGSKMHYSAGNDVGWHPVMPPGHTPLTPAQVADEAAKRFAIARREGLTAHEPYVKWWLCEPDPGRWDFSYYDIHARAVKAAGIRWVPFMIAGPAYATPPWFKGSGESLFARCLEHGEETKTQSIWNPKMRPRVEEFLRRFAEHFDAADIESVLLGVSGDFGESIYAAGGNVWTYLDDPYHVHAGYWCGDPEARAHFRRAMQRQYASIGRLNTAWGTTHKGFDAVAPFLPGDAPNRRARLDFQRWYCAAMTEWSDFWLRATRKAFPRSRILLCTGGSGDSMLGADFSAQAEVAARYDAGIRITNEATDYASNYMLTRHVSTSCRHYGTYFGFEPAGAVAPEGIVGRVYNATASGADELFTYDPAPQGERGERYAGVRRFLVKREPAVDVGLFLNRTSWDLGLLHGFVEAGRALRGVTDFEMVDERLITAGILKRLRVLFWASGEVVEAETARAVEAWVRAGGVLVVSGLDGIETVEGDRRFESALLPPKEVRAPARADRYRLDIGAAGDGALRGPWQGRERGGGFAPPDTTFRWTTAGSEIELPLPEGDEVTVAVRLRAAGPEPGKQSLQVGGREVARIPGEGEHVLRFRLGRDQAAGKKSVRLAFAGPTWQPGTQDTRHLGVAVAWVAVGKGDVPAGDLAAAPLPGFVPGATQERLATDLTRRVGKGAVVCLPQCDVSLPEAASAAVYRTGTFLPGAGVPYPALDGETQGVFTTRFRDGGALLLNFTDREARVRYGGREVTVAPRGIAEVR